MSDSSRPIARSSAELRQLLAIAERDLVSRPANGCAKAAEVVLSLGGVCRHHRPFIEFEDATLGQAKIVALHLDTRFSLAYNAGLQLSTAVLRLHGVRIRKTGFHQRTFTELPSRLPIDMQGIAGYFDRARRKRHAASYDQANLVSESEVDDLIEQVEVFQTWVIQEIERSSPAPS